MKKIITFLSVLWIAFLVIHPDDVSATLACCPKFILKDAVEICPPYGACTSDPVGGQSNVLAACKITPHKYTVFPNDPAFTYTWTVTGGTPATFTGNPLVITWGTGTTGTIKVVMSNAGVGGTCLDSIVQTVCLIDGPKANFTESTDTICAGGLVTFTNTSAGGSIFHWDFGDGTTSSLANPPAHTYSSPGTYTIVLTAQDMGSGSGGTGQHEDKNACGCIDTISKKVVVLPGTGPTIVTDCCFGTVCAGDTSSLCTPMVCGAYNWSVTGGTIVSGANTPCIKVKWNATYTGPTTVTLQACPSGGCPGSTTINVPVLYPNLPINGPNVLCVGDNGSYSLPHMPGTYYNWTVTGGAYTFNKADRNVSFVNITFMSPGTFWVKCVYNNPLAGCSGVDSIQVDVRPKFFINGDETVCEGSQTYFYSNGNANWWVVPAGPVVISGNGGSNPLIQWAGPGNYTVYASPLNTSAFCNDTVFKNVVVKAKPILGNIQGQITICPQSKFTYSITSNVSGSPFVWAVLPPGTATIPSQMGADKDSVVIQFNGNGPWTVTVYQNQEIAPGIFCPSVTKTLTVSKFPVPSITGPATACVDFVQTYTASGPTPPGGFVWTVNPAGQGTIQSGQGTGSVNVLWHGPPNNSNASVSVTTCGGTFTYPVTVNGPPPAYVTPSATPVFCVGTNAILTLTTAPGYSYQWYVNNTTTGTNSNTININIASLSVGTYPYYVMVSQNGCTTKSNTINVIIDPCIPDTSGTCNVYAYFLANVNCSQITLINMSGATPPATITNYLWSASGPGTATFSPNNTSPNPTLTVSASGQYVVTLTVTSSTGCTHTYSTIINVLLPAASFTFTSPVCVNQAAFFTPNPNNPALYNYFWTFGDGATSYTGSTQHAYASAVPSSQIVNLVITDQYGCVATAKDTVHINPLPNCTISANDTIFCPGGSVTLTAACPGMIYQWYKDGSPVGVNSMTYNASKHGEYWVVLTNANGCTAKSNKIYIYMYPTVLAKIQGNSHFCEYPGSTVTFSLSTVNNPAYTYSWSSILPGALFSPPNSSNPSVTLTLPAALPVNYQFIVLVADTNGCTASDTLCVTFFRKPLLTVNSLYLCEGTPVTLTPTPNNPVKFDYQWSNGATIPVITVSTPGFYSLTITDKATGCSASADAGPIYGKPDLSLFPHGCKSMCGVDTVHLYIPLPLNWIPPDNTYASAYPTITWYANGNWAGNGQTLNFPSTIGDQQISVAVQNSHGCIDSTGVFCLKDSCCNIVLESINTHDASCSELSDGWFTITLNPATTGGPFTITSSPIVPPLPTTIIPGVPLTVSNLPAGTYIITVSGPGGNCHQTWDVIIKNKKEHCCFAEADTLFHKIMFPITYTSNTVWDGKYYIDNGVIVTVTNGAILDITNVDVVFGECAGIDFKNGALLRSNNSVYRPCYIDKTWRGLRFLNPGQFDNIINECTFKNAEVALYFVNKTDGVVSNNLFSNCNYGIRVENNSNFNHPIDGNRFVTEQFFPVWIPCYTFVSNSSTYGIYTLYSRLLYAASQNGFVNTKGTSLPRTYGIYQVSGGGLFTANTFTDQTYSMYINTAVFPTVMENNNIEVNTLAVSPLSTIYIDNCNAPVIEVNRNRIFNNFHQYNSYSAIYAQNSANVSVITNSISGFRYGIIASRARNFQVSSNEITDCDINGIYFYGKGTDKNYITCNVVKMRNFFNTRGLYTLDLSTKSEVSSNCIDDSYVSMDIRALTSGLSLPKIRNNSLYNYNLAGINVANYSGNIGTATPFDPGLNTLWSNYNSAIDINSNSTIQVADNFGMFNISFPFVQITSNRPYHSTASCAHQIYNMPSQGNLNISYTCDNFKSLMPSVTGSGGLYSLAPDYREVLGASEDPFSDARMILSSVKDPDINLLNELLVLPSLTANDRNLLKYTYYFNKSDFGNARTNLNQFIPGTSDQSDFKTLKLYELDVLENGWSSLTSGVINALGTVEDKHTANTNFAISLLNNSSTYRDFIFEEPSIGDVEAGTNIKRVSDGESYMMIYPNPATNKLNIEVISSSLVNGKLQVFDISGKVISNYSVNAFSGGFEMDVAGLAKGIYFITITDPSSGIVKAGKFVKN
jgi:hypothetical protein